MGQIDDIAVMLVRELEGFRREIAHFPDDESVWQVVPGITNAAGNLALHVAGNLQHFVGACLGQTGYVRDRQKEFSTRHGTRQEVDRVLAAARDTVASVLRAQSDQRWSEAMPGAPNGMRTTVGLFLVHLAAHAGFHLGQAGYIRRVLAGERAVSAGPIPLDALTIPE